MFELKPKLNTSLAFMLLCTTLMTARISFAQVAASVSNSTEAKAIATNVKQFKIVGSEAEITNDPNIIYLVRDPKIPAIEATERGGKIFISLGENEAVLAERSMQAGGTIPLDVVENTCDAKEQNIQCKLEVDIPFLDTALVWTKHTDSKKIGQPVRRSGQESDFVGRLNSFFSWEDIASSKVKMPNGLNAPKPYKITCPTTKWISPMAENGIVNIFEISSEDSAINPETRVDENRTNSSIYEIKAKFDKNSLVFTSIKNASFASDQSIIFFGDVIGMNVRTKKQTCDYSLKVDFSNLNPQIQKLDDKKLVTSLRTISEWNSFSARSEISKNLPKGLILLNRANLISISKRDGKTPFYYINQFIELKDLK